MKIISIFVAKLFAFQYPEETKDEYTRLINTWNNPEYLVEYAEKNSSYLPTHLSIEDFIEEIMEEAENLEEMFLFHSKGNFQTFNICFQPLHNTEFRHKILSLQKKKYKYLRLYAIKIDDNCFVITGGAIKLTRTMQEHPDTNIELIKLERCKNYLQNNSVFDNDSFFELITE